MTQYVKVNYWPNVANAAVEWALPAADWTWKGEGVTPEPTPEPAPTPQTQGAMSVTTFGAATLAAIAAFAF